MTVGRDLLILHLGIHSISFDSYLTLGRKQSCQCE